MSIGSWRGGRGSELYAFGIGLVATPIPRAGMPVLGAVAGAAGGGTLLRAGDVGFRRRVRREAQFVYELSDCGQQFIDGGGGESAGGWRRDGMFIWG